MHFGIEYELIKSLQKLRPSLIRYACGKRSMSEEDAEDAFQTICMRILAAQDHPLREKLAEPDFEEQIFRYVRSSIRSYQQDLRKAPNRQQEVRLGQLPDSPLDNRTEERLAAKEKVAIAFDMLTKHEKIVLGWTAQGYEVWEIAKITGRTAEEVRRLLMSVKQKLLQRT